MLREIVYPPTEFSDTPRVTVAEIGRGAVEGAEMSYVRLRGELLCHSEAEREIMLGHLQCHIDLTRAEPGCVSFEVLPTDDPMVWRVEETFVDVTAFEMHRTRVARSEWGRLTVGIGRRYEIEGADTQTPPPFREGTAGVSE
ncbi:putative quinol monooxygenase [Rhodococcus rhodochrous]|uniref:putative quinol monooxygenase n=1 Tax=Rhodococcus rhodochrous TaxID=1829 RepID=UPI000B06A7B2|nr:antibiotic biosynthesis monooxygenase [Rhodococcus rhodochrous]